MNRRHRLSKNKFKPGDLVYVPANVKLLKFRSPIGDVGRIQEHMDSHDPLSEGPPIAVQENKRPKHALVVAYDQTTRRYEVAVDGSTWSVHYEDCFPLES